MSDGLFTFGDASDLAGEDWTFVPDDDGFINIQIFRRDLDKRRLVTRTDAQAIADQGIAACNHADTPGASRLRDKIFAEWDSVQRQVPDENGFLNVTALNEYVIQAMIELNASHAADLASKALFYKHSLEVIQSIPENFIQGLAVVAEKATEVAAGMAAKVAAGGAKGLLGALVESPLGVAMLCAAGYLLWKSYRGKHA